MTRVLIVDDDPLVRTLLGRILRASDVTVVAEADDGDQVVDLVRAHHPEVVLMDVRMARLSGIDATQRVRALPGAPGVIALTSFDTPATILDAIAAGVSGFLAKDSAPEEIVAAIRQVAAGEGALSARAARIALERVRDATGHAARHEAAARIAALSTRERSVADCVAEGRSNADIAARLYISETTVKTHLASVMTKTGAANRVQLAVLVARATT